MPELEQFHGTPDSYPTATGRKSSTLPVLNTGWREQAKSLVESDCLSPAMIAIDKR
jgi:hypothetical protein